MLSTAALMLPLSPALAQDYVHSLQAPQQLPVGGNWGRMFPHPDGGWWLFSAGGGDYSVTRLNGELQSQGAPRRLTQRSDLIDHAIAPCPDGSWLHIASRNVDLQNDSAELFRYDADMQLQSTASLALRDTEFRYNDPPLHCGEDYGLTIAQSQGWNQPPLGVRIGADNSVTTERMHAPAFTLGSSLTWVEELGHFAHVRAPFMSHMLEVHMLDDELEFAELRSPHAVDDGMVTWWPQGLARVGRAWIVAHMAKDFETWFDQDTGNVYLQVYDENWALRQTLPVTNLPGPDGAMLPWVAVQGDELVVVYDHSIQPWVVRGLVDLDELENLEPLPIPTAVVGPEREVTAGDATVLGGRYSLHPEGEPMWHGWQVLSVPNGSSVRAPETLSHGYEVLDIEFLADVPGDYVFRLAVGVRNDGGPSDDIMLHLRASQGAAEDAPPRADPGQAPEGVESGQELLLDGSASSDPEGRELVHRWRLLSQPEGQSASIADAHLAQARFTPAADGLYVFELEVWDGLNSDIAQLELWVGEPPRDTDPQDTNPQDSDDPQPYDPGKTCGCSSGSSGSAAGLLLGLGVLLGRRRRIWRARGPRSAW